MPPRELCTRLVAKLLVIHAPDYTATVRWSALVFLVACDKVIDFDRRPDAPSFDAARDCPSSYFTLDGEPSRYHFTAPKTFEDADLICRSESKYAHLAIIDRDVEGFKAIEMFRMMNPNENYAWVGGRQDPNATTLIGGWTWLTGAPIPESLWASNEPDDLDMIESHLEDRTVIGYDRSGRLVDVSSPYIVPVIGVCECDGIELN